jgi:membrane-associated phospholipid phosphatase
MQLWTLITSFGDAGLMVPTAIIITIWLYLVEGKTAAVLWSALLAGAGLLVVATKIAFLGFGIGIHRFDFAGISGHSMMSMAVIPVACLLIGGPSSAWRWAFLLFGAALALLVAVSRLAIHVHSLAEVVTGASLGAAVAVIFIVTARLPAQRMRSTSAAVLSLGVVFLAGFGHPVPSEDLITRAALVLSGRHEPYTKLEWWAEGLEKSSSHRF